ncbi:hypothetical protein EON65_32345 [archaeon]|nr:MAG: hypothetical protein EON65_32345 [archaeon]
MLAIGLVCVLAVVLALFNQGYALEQPSLKNLRSGVKTDYDVLKFDPNAADNNVYRTHLTGNYLSTGRPYSAFLATFPASRFSFYPAVAAGCLQLVKTSISSSTIYNCEYATNGAFFTWDITTTGSLCLGNLISDGKVWQLPTDGSGTGRANFGVTADNNIITGFIDANVLSTKNFTQLITGWGWLVRNGVSNVNVSQDLTFSPGGFTLEKAPRTSVGKYGLTNILFYFSS